MTLANLIELASERLKKFEPWGVLFAFIGLWVALYQFRDDRKVREATLFALASERLVVARELDEKDGDGEPTNNVGHSRVMEEMADLRISLSKIDAHNTHLVQVQLRGADLVDANLAGAVLSGADLRGADLRSARLQGARLQYADLTGATLGGTVFSNASLFCADLSGARVDASTLFDGADLLMANLSVVDLRAVPETSLTEKQLGMACGEASNLREGLEIQLRECSIARAHDPACPRDKQ